VNLLGSAGTAWVGDSAHYSAAYAASLYMDQMIRDAGGTGMKEIMDYLSGSTSRTLDQAIAFVGTAHSIAAWTGVSGFKTDFAANGANFIVTNMDLTNADTGAIGNLDDAGDRLRMILLLFQMLLVRLIPHRLTKFILM
jgi:flagellin